MREIELTLEGFIRSGALAEKFRDAENRGERIVQFMGNAVEHLAHGREFFCLNELLFETFQISDIAAGKHHDFDVTGLVGKGAEVETDAAPVALLVAVAEFQRRKGLLAGKNIIVNRYVGAVDCWMAAVATV